MRRLLAIVGMAAAIGAAAHPAAAGYLGSGAGFTNGTVTSGGVLLTAGGSLTLGTGTDLNALYLYNNAADVDSLSLNGIAAGNCGGAFFANNNGFGCTDSGAGAAVILHGLTSGQLLDFVLTNNTTSAVYASSDGALTTHFAYDTTNIAAQAEADLNLPLGSLTGNPSLVAALLGLGPNTVVVAIEDLPLGFGSEDYNDLVFAFSPVAAPAQDAPEPASAALLGAGLTAFGLMRRRRKSA